MQIGPSAIVPYGMPKQPTTSVVGARARPIEPIAPITPQESQQTGQSAGWIDADWIDAPSRPARIDPYDDYAGDAAANFLALQEQQTAGDTPADGMPLSAHGQAAAAYRLAQGADALFQRGALGFDLSA